MRHICKKLAFRPVRFISQPVGRAEFIVGSCQFFHGCIQFLVHGLEVIRLFVQFQIHRFKRIRLCVQFQIHRFQCVTLCTQCQFRFFSCGDVQKCSNKMVRLVLVPNAVVPLVIRLEIGLKSNFLPGPRNFSKGSDPVEGVILDTGKGLRDIFPSWVHAGQFLVCLICVNEKVVNRFAGLIVDHFVVGDPDGTFFKQRLEFPFGIHQGFFHLRAFGDIHETDQNFSDLPGLIPNGCSID